MPVARTISTHTDDAAACFGASLAKFAETGWNAILVRATKESKDRLSLSIEERIDRNTKKLQDTAMIVGGKGIVELEYQIDYLGDLPKEELQVGMYAYNVKHIVAAQGADEAFWVSYFDKHDPDN